MNEIVKMVAAAILREIVVDDSGEVMNEDAVARAAIKSLGSVETLLAMQALGNTGQAALDVVLPRLKAHWNNNANGRPQSASMNPAFEYMTVDMGQAALKAFVEAALR
jgi:hypothetical protein